MLKKVFTQVLKLSTLVLLFAGCINNNTSNDQDSSWLPKILKKNQSADWYLPDYSYAGYHFGENEPPASLLGTELNIVDFGAKSGDDKDDADAVIVALNAADNIDGVVTIKFPAGKFIIKKPIFITRSHTKLLGAGSGEKGTHLYFPIPLDQQPVPEQLNELQEYLLRYNKRQKTNDLNEEIDPIPFSLYSWSGGYFWFTAEGTRTKKYLSDYDTEPIVLANLISGLRGEHKIKAKQPINLNVGDLVEIQWYNREGENSSLLEHIYIDTVGLPIGFHHWTNPQRPLVTQQVVVTAIDGDQISIKTPLMFDIKPEWTPIIAPWVHIEESGIEGFRMEFPYTRVKPHHVEEGFNAVYLTRLFNGYAKDLVFHNSDNGILTEDACNLTITDVKTTGKRLGHYSVAVSGSQNILVKNLEVYNPTRHALSFNTMAARSVYLNCKVFQNVVLDQHSGLNHQNLFDQIYLSDGTVTDADSDIAMLSEGGAKYWWPAHAPFSTFWNIEVNFANSKISKDTVNIKPIKRGPGANIVGFYANRPINIKYKPFAYMEGINEPNINIKSLYEYQFNKRKNN